MAKKPKTENSKSKDLESVITKGRAGLYVGSDEYVYAKDKDHANWYKVVPQTSPTVRTIDISSAFTVTKGSITLANLVVYGRVAQLHLEIVMGNSTTSSRPVFLATLNNTQYAPMEDCTSASFYQYYLFVGRFWNNSGTWTIDIRPQDAGHSGQTACISWTYILASEV